MESSNYKLKIGELIGQTRAWRQMTQAELAKKSALHSQPLTASKTAIKT